MGRPRRTEEVEFVPPALRGPRGTVKALDMAEAKQKFLHLHSQGLTVESAMAKLGRTKATYNMWRYRDKDFGAAVDRVRAKKAGSEEKAEVGDFGSWRKKYMGMDTFPHQWQWVDVLEGRQPRDLHENMIYLQGRPTRILVNTPPEHAKTTTLTIDYTVYKICQNPNIKIIIISESRDMAKKMLRAIKDRLTHPKYAQLHQDFGPAEGFKVGSASWTAEQIYVGNRDSAEKDPTVEVLGVNSQIYGSRADLILMDDCVTLKTARTSGQRDKMMSWMDQEVASRLGPEGVLLVAGTRVSPNDVYAFLLKRDQDRERRVWTYLAQPAVLEYGDTDDTWEVLWPFRWPGWALSLKRDELDASTWNLVYQQQQVAEDAVFPEEAVDKCRYRGNVGPLTPDGPRKAGMAGLQIVVGLDPAGSGYTAMVVLGVDRAARMLYILDVVNHKGLTPHGLREYIKKISARYRPNEWRIEKNGLQTMISQDTEIRQIIHSAGARLVEHHTGQNKWDADFGVASMAPLFLGALETPSRPGILVPDNGTHKGIKALVDQLVVWQPEMHKMRKTDVVMALWFAVLGARKMLDAGQAMTHANNRWLTKGQLARRQTVNIEDYLAARANDQNIGV